jgi:hypothetical protein
MTELTDDDDVSCITLSKPIIITKNSNPEVLSKFILNQIRIADEKFSLDYDLISNMRLSDLTAPYVSIKYREINIF